MKQTPLTSTALGTVPIIAALFCLGYVASLFLTYSFIVMPGLATLDDRAFVAAFQGLESRFQGPTSIGNIPALIAFPGALLLSMTAAIIHLKRGYRIWLIAAPVLFLIGMVTTIRYNVPANFFIFAAGDPNTINAAQVRAEFDEIAWINWNHFRALTTILAIGCLMRALHLMRLPKAIA